MNIQEITNFVHKGESETLEFKSSLSDWKAILETISAFANKKVALSSLVLAIKIKSEVKR